MSRRLISARDVGLLVYFAALVVPAWMLPEQWLTVVGRALAWSTSRLHPRRTRRHAAALGSLFGARLASPAPDIHYAIVANVHVQNMLYLRVLRPGGWKPRLRVEGAERVRSALEQRRGVIVWTAPLVFDSLLTKTALAGADLPVGHLSHAYHYLSTTSFGVSVLNRFVAAIEARYLAERLVMRPESNYDVLRELRRRIDGNGIVSITAVGGEGRRMYTVPFLDGTLEMPTGAAELARRTGAPLLPVFTVREPDGSFVTRIEPPVAMTTGRTRGDSVRSSFAAFVATLETYVTKWPDQCSPLVYRASEKR